MYIRLSLFVLLGLLASSTDAIRLFKTPTCNYSIGDRWYIQLCCLTQNYQDGLEVKGDVHCFNYSDTEKTQYQIEFEKTYVKGTRPKRPARYNRKF